MVERKQIPHNDELLHKVSLPEHGPWNADTGQNTD